MFGQDCHHVKMAYYDDPVRPSWSAGGTCQTIGMAVGIVASITLLWMLLTPPPPAPLPPMSGSVGAVVTGFRAAVHQTVHNVSARVAETLTKKEDPTKVRKVEPPQGKTFEDMTPEEKQANGEKLREFVANTPGAMVLFYAPWCPHCKKATPALEALKKAYPTVPMMCVNCESVSSDCFGGKDAVFPLRGFPTFCKVEGGRCTEVNTSLQEAAAELMKEEATGATDGATEAAAAVEGDAPVAAPDAANVVETEDSSEFLPGVSI